MGDNNDVSIGNTYNQTFIVDPDTFKLFQSGEVKEDLGKFVKPLMEGKIETGSIIYRGTDGAEKESVVSYAEKALFTTEREEIIKERRWQAGRFMSHHKATDKGRLVLDNAQQVSYAFKMGDPHNYYRYYIFDGSVRVYGDFYMDETGQVQRVDIYNVKELEQDMFIPSGAE
jgi:hypothetical protein